MARPARKGNRLTRLFPRDLQGFCSSFATSAGRNNSISVNRVFNSEFDVQARFLEQDFIDDHDVVDETARRAVDLWDVEGESQSGRRQPISSSAARRYAC
ncbi:hypothetical protein [Bradyrhizobium macuxiense]|uniref:hypothetical protein n=1 Tax=Bradyrhizobium macuxiense TaxID=1755647 RepID=UPI0010A978F5|nr:hypothetical protein [Bradyrhizobium macuxiense]